MESIESLNQRLVDHYGMDTATGKAIFRVVWANEQLENRLVDVTDSGVQLLYSTVRLVHKYPYLKDFYVLERLVEIPEFQQRELPDSKLSYEPIWTFCDSSRNPLPPVFDAAKLVIDVLYAALGKQSLRKYIDTENDPEVREERINKLQEELFGNETQVGDALTYKEGVAGFHPMKESE